MTYRFLRTFAGIWGQARRLDEAGERKFFSKFVHLAILTRSHWEALRKEMRQPERFLLIRGRLQRFFGWMRRSPGWKQRFGGESVAPDDVPENFGLAYLMAGDGYIPPRYDGRAFLLQEMERPGVEWLDPNAGWHKVARRLIVHLVPGGNLTALSVRENVAAVGAQMDACLAEAEAELQLNGFVRLDDSPQLAATS